MIELAGRIARRFATTLSIVIFAPSFVRSQCPGEMPTRPRQPDGRYDLFDIVRRIGRHRNIEAL
jgi:hypothetical protein